MPEGNNSTKYFYLLVFALALSVSFQQMAHGSKNLPQPKQRSGKTNKETGKESTKDASKEGSKELTKDAKNLDHAERAEPAKWFPDWPPTPFDWYLRPLIGSRLEHQKETETTITSMELGVGAGLRGVALGQGNPGASLAPRATYALGNTTVTSSSFSAKSGLYHRVSAGLELPVYAKFAKTTFDLNYSQINGKLVQPSRAAEASVDEGILLRTFDSTSTAISAHYTLGLLRHYIKSWQAPLLQSHDHWISLRISTAFLNTQAAMGPGVTFAKHYSLLPLQESSSQYLGSTRTTYTKLFAGADLFWKLGMQLDAKYIIDSRATNEAAASTQVRLPSQDLNAAPALLVYPSNSAVVSVFIGLKKLFGSFGVGYRYTAEWIALNAGQGKKSEKKESSGIGVFIQ